MLRIVFFNSEHSNYCEGFCFSEEHFISAEFKGGFFSVVYIFIVLENSIENILFCDRIKAE